MGNLIANILTGQGGGQFVTQINKISTYSLTLHFVFYTERKNKNKTI